MAKRKTTRKSSRGSAKSQSSHGWIWGLFGLGIGLSVSAVIYLNNRTQSSVIAPPVAPAESAPAPAAKPAAKDAPDKKEEPRFTFYDMLPTFEVVIPEEDLAVVKTTPQKVVESPGIYVLQAGSFTRHDDADRRRAQLAMLGIESAIQKVAVDDKVYHRVRIGPVSSLDRLNKMRTQLRGAQIDAMVIRVGE